MLPKQATGENSGARGRLQSCFDTDWIKQQIKISWKSKVSFRLKAQKSKGGKKWRKTKMKGKYKAVLEE